MFQLLIEMTCILLLLFPYCLCLLIYCGLSAAESMKKSGQKMLSFSSRKVLGDINNQQAVYSDQPAKSTHGYSKPSKDWKDLQSHKKENSFIRKQENSLVSWFAVVAL